MGHLYSWGAGGLFFGPGYDWAAHRSFQRSLWRRADWPAYTIPLASGCRIHVVYRTVQDEAAIDYLVYDPEWGRAALIARDDGHFMGPGLSWPDLVAAADNGLPGGTTTDPHARLLLLLPAFGDADIPQQDAVVRLAAALRARVSTFDAQPPSAAAAAAAAAAMLETQGLTGPVRWARTADGVRVNDGTYALRNPTSAFALPGDHLVRVGAALAG